MLEQAGFGQIRVFGDYRFEPYEADRSPRMIIYAAKE